MTQQELKRLELNLTRSAIKAKKYFIRGMVGHTESDQGFFPIQSIPIHNTIQDRETTLLEFLEDVGTLNQEHSKLQISHDCLEKQLRDHQEKTIAIDKEFSKKLEELTSRIQDLELFSLE